MSRDAADAHHHRHGAGRRRVDHSRRDGRLYAERRELGLLLDADLGRQAALVAEHPLVSGEVDGTLQDRFDAASPYAQVGGGGGDVVSLTPQRTALPVDGEVVAVASGRRDASTRSTRTCFT